MLKWVGVAVVLAVLCSAAAGVARADTLQGCGDCGGGIYTLSYNPTPVSTTATTQTFAVSLTINTAAYTGSSQGFVDSIGLQLNLLPTGTVSNVSAVLVAAPGVASDWTIQTGGTNSGGCSGTGNFFCTSLNDAFETSSSPSKVGGTQTWTWDITISKSQSLITAPLGDDLKVAFMTPPDNFDHVQVSDSIGLGPSGPPTSVPEPGSLALLGTGLLALAPIIRRKLSA